MTKEVETILLENLALILVNNEDLEDSKTDILSDAETKTELRKIKLVDWTEDMLSTAASYNIISFKNNTVQRELAEQLVASSKSKKILNDEFKDLKETCLETFDEI